MSVFGGVYVINLDRRKDRLDQITEELARLELPFTRFAGIDQRPGILGCGLSHLAVLKEARRLGLKNVLILEDDFTLVVEPNVFWSEVHAFFQSGMPYDVAMLAYNITHARPHSQGILKVLEAQTASAYVVHKRFYDQLISLYEESMPLLAETGHHWVYANDQVWKKLQAGADWYAFEKRLGRQRPSYSDNSERFVDHVY
jgi:glycosyl transferase family 25